MNASASTELVMPVLAAQLDAIANRQVPADADLAAEHHRLSPITVLPAMPTCAASSDVPAEHHAVGDLHQVVDLGARP